MYCKYLSKSLNGNLRCKLSKTITYIDKCKKCLKFEPRANKPIKKVSNKKITVTEETYNKVMQRDKYKCRLCGTSLNLHLHHIMRSWKRLNKQYKQLYNFVSGIVI